MLHPAGGDVGFWSSFATTSKAKAERLHARIVQQNTGTQLLFKILQEWKVADGVVERDCGLTDRMARR